MMIRNYYERFIWFLCAVFKKNWEKKGVQFYRQLQLQSQFVTVLPYGNTDVWISKSTETYTRVTYINEVKFKKCFFKRKSWKLLKCIFFPFFINIDDNKVYNIQQLYTNLFVLNTQPFLIIFLYLDSDFNLTSNFNELS